LGQAATLAVSLALGLNGCAVALHRPPSPADSLLAQLRLERVVADHWTVLEVSRPELAARADVTVTHLPDPTLEQAKWDAQVSRAGLGALDEIFIDALSQDSYITWLVLEWELEAMGGRVAFHWTNLGDLAPGRSVFDKSIEILKAQRIEGAPDAQRFISLLTSVSTLAKNVRVEYEERARRNIRLSRPEAMRAIGYLRELIAPAEASPFGLPAELRAPSDSTWQSELVHSAESTIEQQVNPSLDSLATFLEQNADEGTDTPGLARFPGGTRHFATLLRYRSTIDVTPAEAHAIGVREVARLAVLADSARRVAGLPAHRDSLRRVLATDTTFAVNLERSIPEAAAQIFERATRSLDSLFQPTPAMPLAIAVMRRETDVSPLVAYEPATAARTSARYVINPLQLEARSALALPGLIIGDLVPGLHRQQAIQFENTSLPAFRRIGYHDGFVGGWQLYVLDVADSLSGVLLPWERYSLRLRELAAACGLVVDTGINELGWTRHAALDFLRSYLPWDDADLEREYVIAAIESPGELSAPTLGARELRGLRRWAMTELGARFDLAAFHREVLRVGSVPLPILGTHLERWIWDQAHPPTPPPPPGVRR
jgi:uncharacterized protein (DUF885 family)